MLLHSQGAAAPPPHEREETLLFSSFANLQFSFFRQKNTFSTSAETSQQIHLNFFRLRAHEKRKSFVEKFIAVCTSRARTQVCSNFHQYKIKQNLIPKSDSRKNLK